MSHRDHRGHGGEKSRRLTVPYLRHPCNLWIVRFDFGSDPQISQITQMGSLLAVRLSALGALGGQVFALDEDFSHRDHRGHGGEPSQFLLAVRGLIPFGGFSPTRSQPKPGPRRRHRSRHESGSDGSTRGSLLRTAGSILARDRAE